MSFLDSIKDFATNNKEMLIGAVGGAGAVGVAWGAKAYLNKRAVKKADAAIDAAVANANKSSAAEAIAPAPSA